AGAREPRLCDAARRAAVVVDGVRVVAGLAGLDGAVATDRDDADAGGSAAEVACLGGAGGAAAVARRRRVPIVAGLGPGDDAVAADRGADARRAAAAVSALD